MKISIDNENKVIEFWVQKGESIEMTSELSNFLESYQKKKYIKCFYQSGNESLEELTSKLLIENQVLING